MLGVENSTSLQSALVLLTVVRQYWPQMTPHVSMSPASVFRAVQGGSPALLFKAWKLSQEFRLAAGWHQNLPPTLLAVEQQELSSTGHMVWRPVERSKVPLFLGTPVRLRCWIWGADPQQYVWSLNGTRQPSAAWLCPLHNVLKSEIVVNAPGTYQCIATSSDGRASQPTNIEVCFDNFLMLCPSNNLLLLLWFLLLVHRLCCRRPRSRVILCHGCLNSKGQSLMS